MVIVLLKIDLKKKKKNVVRKRETEKNGDVQPQRR